MVTVLMCVYDTPPSLLDWAIGSILAQTFEDLEFLIIDDGSRDPATRACLEQATRRDSRIQLRPEVHRGLTPSLNLGLSLARGDLVARQDADDWSERGRLALQAAFLDHHPGIALVGSAAWTHQHDGTPLWPVRMPETHAQILDALWNGNPFFHGSVMFRRRDALNTGGYREELGCSQDYDFFWRLTEAGGAANLPEPLYHYRYSASSVSASRAGDQARAHAAARALARARRQGSPEDVRAALASARPDAFRVSLKQADHLMLAGEYRSAACGYWRLLRSRPWSALAWAKLARLAVFRAVPIAREACF